VDRYGNAKALQNASLMAGNAELDFAKGILFTVTKADGIRIDRANRRLGLNGSGITVTIPNLKKGQAIRIVSRIGNKSGTNRYLEATTNLTVKSGFAAHDKDEQITNEATVTDDGSISFTTKEGGINLYSITITESGSGEGSTTEPSSNDIINNAVPVNTNKNQAVLTLANGDKKYYDTESLSSIDIDNETNQINVVPASGDADIYYGSVAGLSFSKKAESGSEGDYANVEGKVNITEAKGWMESAYVKWMPFADATSYIVYIKGGQYTEWTKLDDQLVRDYGTYGRADAVGLLAGSDYAFKVVPLFANAATPSEANANEASGISVRNYDRTGYAHFNYSGVGAYDDNGQLKRCAKVFYVTKNTAKTISTNVAGAEQNPCVGLQAIIDAYQKGVDKTPIAFRFVGMVDVNDIGSYSSSEEGLQIKGKNADSELNITIEGIGDDATIKGFGFLVRNAKSVEFRNFGIIRCMDDGISLDTDNSNIWIHNMDVFYGKHGSGDHAKGDGAIDVKSDSKYVTVSYCRYWDTGKSNMFGMKNESGPNYISYHHNWFDHSDSRHPRVRTMTVHVYNNFFDNVAKYGVGATTGASVFVENNYFLKTKKPILSSRQGTDAQGDGTFSGENGGMIKACGNYFDRSIANFKYFTQKNPAATGYDAYETDSRDEQVPSTEVTKVGSTSYNNFDTNPSLIYSYTPDAADEVPAIVTGFYGAGRLNHGDFSYTFKDNVGNDDSDSAYDSILGSLLDNYTSTLIGIFGDDNSSSGEQGGGSEGGNTGDNTGGETGGTTISTAVECNFAGNAPSSSLFSINGNYSTSKGTATVNGTTYSTCLKMESSTSIKFTIEKAMKLTLVFASTETGKRVKVDGTNYTADSNAVVTVDLAAGTHEITKGDSINLFFIGLSE
jgi:pectate lyase